MPSVEPWHFWWPWMSFEGHFCDLLTVVTLCVQVMCDLLAIAKFGCVVLFTGWFHRCIRLEHINASLMHRWNQPVNKTTYPFFSAFWWHTGSIVFVQYKWLSGKRTLVWRVLDPQYWCNYQSGWFPGHAGQKGRVVCHMGCTVGGLYVGNTTSRPGVVSWFFVQDCGGN